jgi:hypothetical protein
LPRFGNQEAGLDVPREDSKSRTRQSEARSAKDLEKAWQQEDRFEIEERMRKIAPPVRTEPRCRVCTHPHRQWIEAMLMRGHSNRAIAESVPVAEGERPLHKNTLKTHYQNHMALDEAAIRAILEEEANLSAQNFEEGVRGAITKRGVLEVMLRKGYEDVIAGITTVEPKDLIQIAKLVAEMDTNVNAAAVEEAKAQINIFMQAIHDVCDEETRKAIGERVARLRKGESIEAKLEKAIMPPPPEEEEIEDAEVVEA